VRNILLAIPVYNEKNTIQTLLEQTLANLPPEISAIAMIDDGSTDGSSEALDAGAAMDRRILVFHQKQNGGYGRSMQTALAIGKDRGAKAVITMDCDLQHRPEDLSRFAEMPEEIDLVSGSRYMPDSRAVGQQAPKDRMEINGRITRALNLRYGWNLTDSFCGFKRYKLVPGLEKLHEDGYAFPMEYWAFARALGQTISEIPVSRIYTTDNRSFGEDLDRRWRRYAYYLRTWRRAEARFGLTPGSLFSAG